jgi:hypothetical protein
MRPQAGDFPEYYANYITKAKENDVTASLEICTNETFSLLKTIPATSGNFSYAPSKWTIKQLVIHLADSERVFAYRALRFARGDAQQPLPFEENDYAANSEAEIRSLTSVIEEFEAVRKSTLLFYKNLSSESLQRAGLMAGHRTTVNALGFAISGHTSHHMEVLKERYLEK